MVIKSYVRLLFGLAVAMMTLSAVGSSHPLGNFTINHYARIEPGLRLVNIRYVVDMAEIPTFQDLRVVDTNGDGSCTADELNEYARHAASEYVARLSLDLDGSPLALNLASSRAELRPGSGGMSTLRIECDFQSSVLAIGPEAHRCRFEDSNFADRLGWREAVVAPAAGISAFDASAFGNGLTDELNAYPENSLTAPLDERNADFSFVAGSMPEGARALQTRDGRTVATSRDRLAELIAVGKVTPLVALLGLLIAAGLGSVHALSPGHGKTVVGAYLVGSRGTAKHAAFLGLTVTVTHTLGVFALGLATLFASQYILPEKLYPILSFASGAMVVAIGLSLFLRRLRMATGRFSKHTGHSHPLEHSHSTDELGVAHDHSHRHTHESGVTHSHGGRVHSHLPPGADGSRISWRSLLALGVSGGLLPCPSALVVLLSAISLHRVGYGLVLVIAFSLGLACTLTAVGLAFVYAGRLMKRSIKADGFARMLPVASALFITVAGGIICYEAFGGVAPLFRQLTSFLSSFVSSFSGTPIAAGTFSTTSLLIFGLLFGIKHATEADHLAAVSTIVTERQSVTGSALIGALWGVGHTVSLVVAGVAVLLLHVRIGEKLSLFLELGVGVMLVGLGANALRRIVRGDKLHRHSHSHGSRLHAHFHLHEENDAPSDHHHRLKYERWTNIRMRPLIVGMMHGLAGSSAVVVVVVSAISSPIAGLGFIAVFGVGSIFGMLLMSTLISLPLRFTALRFRRASQAVQMLAGAFSVGLGAMMIYEIGFQGGLF